MITDHKYAKNQALISLIFLYISTSREGVQCGRREENQIFTIWEDDWILMETWNGCKTGYKLPDILHLILEGLFLISLIEGRLLISLIERLLLPLKMDAPNMCIVDILRSLVMLIVMEKPSRKKKKEIVPC